MIAGTGAVLIKEPADGGGPQIIEYVRLRIKQHSFHFLRFRGAEPFVHDICSEAALFAPENRSRQEGFADFAVQPFASTITYLEACGKSFCVFDDFLIQIGHAHFEAVRHRELIAVHQQFIRQGRTQLDELKASQFVGFGHQIREVPPRTLELRPRPQAAKRPI